MCRSHISLCIYLDWATHMHLIWKYILASKIYISRNMSADDCTTINHYNTPQCGLRYSSTHTIQHYDSVWVRMLSGGKWRLALWVLAARCNQMFLEMTSCPVRWSRAPWEIKTPLPVTANAVLITRRGCAELDVRPLRKTMLKAE